MEKTTKFAWAIMLVLGTMFLMSGYASAYTIDGTLDGDVWDVDICTGAWSDLSTWVPGSGIDFVVEDNENPNLEGSLYTGVHRIGTGSVNFFYDEPQVLLDNYGSGGLVWEPWSTGDREQYDIEAMYFDQDDDDIYIAIVTSLPENSIPYTERISGDLALDLDNDGSYEYGVKLNTRGSLVQFGVYYLPDWSSTPNYISGNLPAYFEGVMEGGYKMGEENEKAEGAYVPACTSTGIIDNGYNNYIIELRIPKNLIGNPGPVDFFGGDLYHADLCTNDHITPLESGQPPLASIGNFVWYDSNKDGIQNEGVGSGIGGVPVYLYDCGPDGIADTADDIQMGSTTTNPGGYYLFSGLDPGNYFVEFIPLQGYVFTLQDQGADDTVDSDANPLTGKTICTTLFEDENDMTWDAGMYLGELDLGTIGFWKHQFAVATGHNKGKAQIDGDTLLSFLPIDVFGTTIDTLDEGYDVLWIKKAPMDQRAIQQCFGSLLNSANGGVAGGTMVDTDYDGVPDMTFNAAMAEAESRYSADPPDYEGAKDICDSINNMNQ